ncbi:MAG: hypothetical protein IID44_05710 [Planctomycetes bacterium]|nr:hypothetical protein [Planctomycetota bacterium]
MTLDDHLREVDGWKQQTMERLKPLSDAQRRQELRRAREQVESRIGRSLRESVSQHDRSTGIS